MVEREPMVRGPRGSRLTSRVRATRLFELSYSSCATPAESLGLNVESEAD